MYIKHEKAEIVNSLSSEIDKRLFEMTITKAHNFRQFITSNQYSISSLILEDDNTHIENYLGFLDFIVEDIEQDNIEPEEYITPDLLDWIPDILAADVEKAIDHGFKGNATSYLSSVKVYFDTFTLEDLFLANLDERGHFNQLLVSTHLKLRKRKLWHAQCLLKLIGGRKDLHLPSYVCKSILREHKQRIKRAQNYINNNYIINGKGEKFCLSEVVRATSHRVAENLNIVKTFERIAQPDPKKPKVFEWAFITMTLPPDYHPHPSMGQDKYNGVSPYESAREMKRRWNLVRARLRKLGIEPGADYYGALVSEAHKDGCQHLHALFFYRASQLTEIKRIFLSVFPNLNADQKDEKCSFKLDNGKAKASSYAFKYINKSTTLFDADLDIFGKHDEATQNAIANSAFRSYNNIRGVSYFGLENCLSKWRVLCRHFKRIGLEGRLKTVIENKDFYSFLEELHFSYIENEYASKIVRRTDIYGDTTERVSKTFIGVKINTVLHLKNFFSKCVGKLVKGAFKAALAQRAEEKKEEFNQLKPSVLVSHNYSSGVQNTGAQSRTTEITKAGEQLMREFSLFGVNFSPDYLYLRPVESF